MKSPETEVLATVNDSLHESLDSTGLFDRVAHILDAARGRVVRSVNQETVSAYWLIGREIVEALQTGEARAAYGKALIADLAKRLTQRYGQGFAATNLSYFRRFYQAYQHIQIFHPLGEKSLQGIALPDPDAVVANPPKEFHPNLSWSHYRVLMRVANLAAREFYENEALRSNWSRRDLERQVL